VEQEEEEEEEEAPLWENMEILSERVKNGVLVQLRGRTIKL